MKTILSIYEKSGNQPKQTVYSKQEVVTKQKSSLVNKATTVGASKFPDLANYESNYDLDQYSKYLS